MTAEQLLGMPLELAEALLREGGCEIRVTEYTAPGRVPHGKDNRVIQARLHGSCATLVYAGFNTIAENRYEGNLDGDNE